jgi:hypothetical protein
VDKDIPIATAGWSAWLNATGLLIASFITVAAMSLQARPDAEVVAVVFPPWWSSQQALLAATSANARIVRLTALSSVLVVQPDDAGGLKSLHDAGVWLAIDPKAIAACFTSQSGI